jgi:hypothetical protein
VQHGPVPAVRAHALPPGGTVARGHGVHVMFATLAEGAVEAMQWAGAADELHTAPGLSGASTALAQV